MKESNKSSGWLSDFARSHPGFIAVGFFVGAMAVLMLVVLLMVAVFGV